MSTHDPESIFDDIPNLDDVSLSVSLPRGTVMKWWDEGHISNWVKENIFQVMQVHADVDVQSLDRTTAHERSTCRLIIRGISREKRRRVTDLLGFTDMRQIADISGKTEEFFDKPPCNKDESDIYLTEEDIDN